MHQARAAPPRGFDSLPSLSDVGTFSFWWILPFWYFCFLLQYKARLALYAERKQKYQNGNIHRKLKVPMSEREGKLSNPRGAAARARCMEKIYGNLRKPARRRRARAMRWFCRSQKYSTKFSTGSNSNLVSTTAVVPRCVHTRVLNLVLYYLMVTTGGGYQKGWFEWRGLL